MFVYLFIYFVSGLIVFPLRKIVFGSGQNTSPFWGQHRPHFAPAEGRCSSAAAGTGAAPLQAGASLPSAAGPEPVNRQKRAGALHRYTTRSGHEHLQAQRLSHPSQYITARAVSIFHCFNTAEEEGKKRDEELSVHVEL